MAKTRFARARKKPELPVTPCIIGLILLLLIIRFRPHGSSDLLAQHEHVTALSPKKSVHDNLDDRKARDATAHKKHMSRALSNLTTLQQIDLGTPCLQQVEKPVPITGPSNKRILGEMVPKYVCTTHLSPLADRRQCCCRPELKDNEPLSNEVRCLPSFIVIGAQKSGTTALMGFLITHPQFTPPVNKEIHWLDQPRKFRRGINWYITRFKKTTNPASLITAEDTPAYIYASHAMHRMQQGLGTHAMNHVRFVVMLRNPTDRAYSEYQMHMRRYAQEQTAWKVFKQLWGNISTCLVKKHTPSQKKILRPAQCFVTFLPQYQLSHKLARVKRDNVQHCQKSEDGEEAVKCFRRHFPPTLMLPSTEHFFENQVRKMNKCLRKEPEKEFQEKSCYLYNISSNTARYHVFRSMYAYQLKRWFKVYPPSQFIFLANSQLRHELQPTMDQLHDFVGLPDYTYKPLGKRELDAVIDKEYPDLEARGNVKTTKYPPLEKAPQTLLDAFFRPHNEELWTLLRANGHESVVPILQKEFAPKSTKEEMDIIDFSSLGERRG